MTNPTPTPSQVQPIAAKDGDRYQPTVMRCLTGAAISGGFAYACLLLTTSIAQTFAHKPIHSNNPIAINISTAVRTLVTGVSTLGTCVFAFAAFGLFCLGIQLFLQKMMNKTTPSIDG